MKNNISSMTSFKRYTEFVRKYAVQGLSAFDVNGIFAVSVNMALSMLSVKIPWPHTRVHIKLVMGEMGNNLAVRTVSKKYRKKTSDHAC